MIIGVIADLAARGVTVTLQDGRLRAGPPAALTPEVRDLIQRHRDWIKHELSRPEIDLAPGWRERQGIAQWRKDWTPIWLQWQDYLAAHPEWQPPAPFEMRCKVNELVAAWNCQTGQQRHGDEVLAQLAPEDYRDRELMNPGALALYVMTCLTSPPPVATVATVAVATSVQPESAAATEAQEERAAILEYEAGFTRAEAQMRAGLVKSS